MLWTGMMNLFCHKQCPLSVGPAQIISLKIYTLHEKASLMIIRLTHLETLKAFQLKFYRPFVLKQG